MIAEQMSGSFVVVDPSRNPRSSKWHAAAAAADVVNTLRVKRHRHDTSHYFDPSQTAPPKNDCTMAVLALVLLPVEPAPRQWTNKDGKKKRPCNSNSSLILMSNGERGRRRANIDLARSHIDILGTTLVDLQWSIWRRKRKG